MEHVSTIYVLYVQRNLLTFFSSFRAANKLHTPTAIDKWIVVSFEGQRRFNQEAAMRVVTDFVTGCISVGE